MYDLSYKVCVPFGFVLLKVTEILTTFTSKLTRFVIINFMAQVLSIELSLY